MHTRSWPEDHPRGFVQRREGLKKSSPKLAAFRASTARFAKAPFELDLQRIMHEAIVEISKEFEMRLHAVATCPTHVHVIYSFKSPACTCGAAKRCYRNCPAKAFAERIFIRMKRKMGQQIAQLRGTSARRWLSRGWDASPVRSRSHFDHLLATYLPSHETDQCGMFRSFQSPLTT